MKPKSRSPDSTQKVGSAGRSGKAEWSLPITVSGKLFLSLQTADAGQNLIILMKGQGFKHCAELTKELLKQKMHLNSITECVSDYQQKYIQIHKMYPHLADAFTPAMWQNPNVWIKFISDSKSENFQKK